MELLHQRCRELALLQILSDFIDTDQMLRLLYGFPESVGH